MNTSATGQESRSRRYPIVVEPNALLQEIAKKQVRVVDVRKADEYNQDHIPGAVSIPLANILNADSLEKVAEVYGDAGIDDNIHVVVYDDTFGALAARVAWTLEYIGHPNVSLLAVAYSTWKSMGLEVESEPAVYPKVKHSLKVN
ncbi:MAG: sulfurtransferase, partial [Nitrososphaerales archaeon]